MEPKNPNIVNRLEINPTIIHKLIQGGFQTAEDILENTLKDFEKISLSESEADIVTHETRPEVYQSNINCTKGLYYGMKHRMDFTEEHFFPPSSVTEIAGKAGSGKTQLCMHYCIRAFLPVSDGGLGGCILYIHTEGSFPIERYHQMATCYVARHPQYEVRKFTDKLVLYKLLDIDADPKLFDETIPMLIERLGIRMIIIDSVAALFRGDPDWDNQDLRLLKLRKFCFQIWSLAHHYNVILLCTNQVTEAPMEGVTDAAAFYYQPCLGRIWQEILTTSCMVVKVNASECAASPQSRALHVIKSPYIGTTIIYFDICETGLMPHEFR